MPQAKFKNVKTNNPSPPKKQMNKISGIQIQTNIFNLLEKIEPKK